MTSSYKEARGRIEELTRKLIFASSSDDEDASIRPDSGSLEPEATFVNEEQSTDTLTQARITVDNQSVLKISELITALQNPETLDSAWTELNELASQSSGTFIF